jgi:hypothetical protein
VTTVTNESNESKELLVPLAREMLVAAYVRQFDGGDRLDWRVWAEQASRDRETTGRALDGLQDLYLVAALGGRIDVSTSGAEVVERSRPVDPAVADLVGRQFALRRKILDALNELLLREGTMGAMAPDRIASAVGAADGECVQPALRVLCDYCLVTSGEVGRRLDSPAYRIGAGGRDALAAERVLWPLSAA